MPLRISPASPPDIKPLELGELRGAPAPRYTEPIPTRKAFGEALAWLAGHRPDLVVLDGEVGNSTHTEDFQAVCEEASGQDLDSFFDVWVRTPSKPTTW